MKINISEGTEILVVTGPESSGKSTCANLIAQKYALPLVPEYAREYLNEHGSKYSLVDIKNITALQIHAEAKANEDNGLIICDTDIVTLEIWAIEKFGCSLSIVDDLILKKHYLLCYPDIPWEPDPLRENPEDRMRLFEQYERYLRILEVPFTVLREEDRKTLELSV